jgi:hypothetical protein
MSDPEHPPKLVHPRPLVAPLCRPLHNCVAPYLTDVASMPTLLFPARCCLQVVALSSLLGRHLATDTPTPTRYAALPDALLDIICMQLREFHMCYVSLADHTQGISSEYIMSFHLCSPMHNLYYSPNHSY